MSVSRIEELYSGLYDSSNSHARMTVIFNTRREIGKANNYLLSPHHYHAFTWGSMYDDSLIDIRLNALEHALPPPTVPSP